MTTFLVRISRGFGWLVAGLTIAPIALVVVVALWRGPVPQPLAPAAPVPAVRDVLAPPDWMAWSLVRTLAIGAMAAGFAFVIALPAGHALIHAVGRVRRAALAALIAWPLLAPPCIIAYAWTLLATQKTWLARFLVGVLGWNTHGMAPVVAAWIQAAWLWPIPALALAAAYRLRGRAAFRLALIDAAPGRAFRRAALPAMAGILAAAAAIVFLLSLGDATIAPLMLVRVWPTEMLEEVTRAHRYADPTRYVLWRSWPMLAVVALLGSIAYLGVRPLLRDSDRVPGGDLGDAAGHAARWTTPAVLLTTGVSLLPMIVLVCELWTAGTPMREALVGTAVYKNEWRATLITAALAAVAGAALGLLAITERSDAAWRRRMTGAITAALMVLAALPPVVLGRSLISAFDRDWGIPPSWNWQPYDDAPIAWLAGLVGRFGFLPMLLVWTARRAAGDETADAARVDGASRASVLAHVRLAQLARPLAAGALLLGCLALSELSVSSMVAPVRFGGSLAVTVDQQVHFGRQTETVATSLLLTVPAMAAAFGTAWLMTRKR